MSLTRAEIESELVSRQKARMDVVGMSLSFNGANLDLNSAIGFAVRQCGGTVASLSAVANSDLNGFGPAEHDKLLDIAEYRLLLNIKGRWGRVDIRAGQLEESLSQFAKDLDKDIENKLKELKDSYGFGGSALSAGTLDYDFAQTTEL